MLGLARVQLQRRLLRQGGERWLASEDGGGHEGSKYSSNWLRQSFVGHFESLGHRVEPSASLVPAAGEDSLLFTTAGMVPFKSNFLNLTGGRACSVQRCVRAGGKHNDIEDVGLTARHLTFFEMLGNFSFGDYGKAEAIDYAWRYLTGTLGLERERLRVTTHEDDPDTQQLWRGMFGVQTTPLRDDNWWSLGDDVAGLPAGFCTEIFYDTGLREGAAGPRVDRWVEVWNLVFMQFRTTGVPGRLEPLGRVCVDTGMGLERLAATMQGKCSTFEIDSMAPLVAFVWQRWSGRAAASYEALSAAAEPVSARIVADHLRAACFLIADGVLPGPNERGYVLRRLLRRAFAVAQVHLDAQLDGEAGRLLCDGYVDVLCRLMGDAHPLLLQHRQRVVQALATELALFANVVAEGMAVLQHKLASTKQRTALSPEFVFQLHDTLGFPVDMTRAVAAKRGVAVDAPAVEALMEAQRQRGRVSWKQAPSRTVGSGAGMGQPVTAALVERCKQLALRTTFCGDETADVSGRLAAQLLVNEEERTRWIAVEPCPFYARGGGQVGDRGTVWLRNRAQQLVAFDVLDAVSPVDGCTALCIGARSDDAASRAAAELDQRRFDEEFAGDAVSRVDGQLRAGAARNHTATHLLRAALCRVLGDVQQAGSAVQPDKLRFDFSFARSLTAAELQAVERLVNAWIDADLPVDTFSAPLDRALAMGAASLPGEAYRADVRVVRVAGQQDSGEPVSMELCGGTHVASSGRLGVFKILSESSTAAGIRRIEAVTGGAALDWLREQAEALKSVAQVLGAPSTYAVRGEVERLLAERGELARQLGQLRALMAQSMSQTPLHIVQCQHNALTVYVYDFDPHIVDAKALRKHAGSMRPRRPNEAHVLLSGVNFVCLLSPDGQLTTPAFLAALFARFQGVGGGGPHLAQGRFHTCDGLADALREMPAISN